MPLLSHLTQKTKKNLSFPCFTLSTPTGSRLGQEFPKSARWAACLFFMAPLRGAAWGEGKRPWGFLDSSSAEPRADTGPPKMLPRNSRHHPPRHSFINMNSLDKLFRTETREEGKLGMACQGLPQTGFCRQLLANKGKQGLRRPPAVWSCDLPWLHYKDTLFLLERWFYWGSDCVISGTGKKSYFKS